MLSAFAEVPSWNFIPSRRVKTTLLGSGVVHDSASFGCGLPSASSVTRVSAIPMRVFSTASSENGDRDATGLNGSDMARLELSWLCPPSGVVQAAAATLMHIAAMKAHAERRPCFSVVRIIIISPFLVLYGADL